MLPISSSLSKKEAIEEARKDNQGLVLWTDVSKLNQGQTAAAVCWKDKSIAKWKERSIFLGNNKEVLDAELWAISEAFKPVRSHTILVCALHLAYKPL